MARHTAVARGVLIAAVAWAPLFGEAWAETLEEALAAAYNTNPGLLAARAGLRATDEEVPQALSAWRPTVEVAADYGWSANKTNLGGNNTGGAVTTFGQHRNPSSWTATLTQPIFNGTSNFAALDGAENTVQAARARLLDTEQNVLLEAATAYVNVLRDQAVLELNTNNEQVLKRQLEATEDRFAVGEITRTDVNQAEARLARATADRIQSEGNLEASRAEYDKVVGSEPGLLSRPELPADLPEALDQVVQAAIDANPGVVAARYDEASAMDNIREVRGELLPELDFEASTGQGWDASTEHSRTTTYEAKFSLNVPIYQQGAVYSRLREAKQSAAKARLTIRDEERSARQSGRTAWESLQSARAQVVSFQAQIHAAEVALDGVEREAAVGSRTVLDVLDAEQEVLDAKVSLVRAERDEMVAVFQVLAAMGRLNARALALPVDVYDPTVHFDEVKWKFFGGDSSGDVNTPEGAVMGGEGNARK